MWITNHRDENFKSFQNYPTVPTQTFLREAQTISEAELIRYKW